MSSRTDHSMGLNISELPGLAGGGHQWGISGDDLLKPKALEMRDRRDDQTEGDGQESRWTSQHHFPGWNSEKSKHLTEAGLQVLMETYLPRWKDRRVHFKSFYLDF